MMPDILIVYLMLGALVAMILFIWFNTSAFVEYMALLGLRYVAYVGEFLAATKDDPIITYHEYIAANHNCFFVRMISCPKCFCVQLSALINLPIFLTLHLLFNVLVWVLFPASVLITAFTALLLYYKLVNIMK